MQLMIEIPSNFAMCAQLDPPYAAMVNIFQPIVTILRSLDLNLARSYMYMACCSEPIAGTKVHQRDVGSDHAAMP
jgi:hypothetical protein